MCDCVCRSIRVQIRTTASFAREVEGDVQHVVGYFQTMPQLINSSTDLDIDGFDLPWTPRSTTLMLGGLGSPLIEFWNLLL